MKFQDYEYKRPELDEIKKEFSELLKVLKTAKDFDSFEEVLSKIQKIRANFETMSSLVNIRYKINTKDEFYINERKIIDEISPSVQNLDKDFFQVIVNSKFKKDFKKKYGRNLLERMELSLKVINPKILQLLEKENKLVSEYSKLTGSAKVLFQEKNMNLAEIRTFFESKDRNIRKSANEAYWRFFSDNENKFDKIYDELVKVRNEVAVKLGYENFVDLAYDRWGRNDWDKKMVKQFRKNLLNNFISFTNKVRRWQRNNLKLDKLKYYDEFLFLSESIKPKGDTNSKIENTKKMFSKIGDETKVFFNYMANNNLLDLIPRDGKVGGGFCEFIKNEKSPFIFMNFNDTPKDIMTLIHESGHALDCYLNKDKDFLEFGFLGADIAEIHSMSMEFFSWPWSNLFFEKPDKFKLIHLVESTLFIPYGLLIDEFQHWVYENPNVSPQQRKNKWLEIEKKYLPFRDYGGNEFLERGGFWFRQLHLFELPFYYIDYVIAQLCAFQYLLKSRENFEKAWKGYICLIDASIDKSFFETIKVGNLNNPFEEKTIKEITSDIEKLFDELSSG